MYDDDWTKRLAKLSVAASKLEPMNGIADGVIRMQPFQSGRTHQQWIIVGDRIQNRYDASRVLDIAKASNRNGAQVCAYTFNGGDNQRWTFEYARQ